MGLMVKNSQYDVEEEWNLDPIKVLQFTVFRGLMWLPTLTLPLLPSSLVSLHTHTIHYIVHAPFHVINMYKKCLPKITFNCGIKQRIYNLDFNFLQISVKWKIRGES